MFYTWGNGDKADKIYDALTEQIKIRELSHNVSIDRKDLSQEQGNIPEYQKKINTSEKVVVLFSANYLMRQRCLEELSIILEKESNK